MKAIAFPNVLSPVAAQVMWVERQIAAFEKLPPAAQAEARNRQLTVLVRHAKAHSPYWRDKLAAFTTSVRFEDLPILSRQDLQIHGAALRCPQETPLPNITKLIVARSSGSTGAPVEVTKGNPLYQIFYSAQAIRQNAWHGLDVTRDVLAIRDSPDGINNGAWGSVPGEIGPTGRAFVKNMVEHSPEAIWEWMREQTAPYVVTTAAMVLRLAQIALADKQHSRRFEAFMTFGEAVRPEHRQAARDAFGARIIDRYSSEEVGWMAFQCPRHDHYHALTATTHLEIVDDDNRPVAPGQEGRVLVTSMHSYAMPIIRYDIGDRAIAGGSCDCGIKLPVIREILGRERSLILLPDGTSRLARLTGEYWRTIAPVTEYRVVQYADGEVEAFVVAQRPLAAEEIRAMEAMLRETLHAALKVRVTPVEHIRWDSRWKRIDVTRVNRLRGEVA
jgi:phenylacetate-CoA ligase